MIRNPSKDSRRHRLAGVLFLGFAALSLVGCESAAQLGALDAGQGVASGATNPNLATGGVGTEALASNALGQNQVGDFGLGTNQPNLDSAGKGTNPPVLGFRPPSLPSAPKLPSVPKLPKIPKIKIPPIRIPPIRFPRFGGFGRGPSCFVAGTPVWTPDGARAIETLTVGETVFTRADAQVASVGGVPAVGALPAESIVRVTKNVADHLRVLVVEDEAGRTWTIRTTDGHPFWVPGYAWVDAADLIPGLRLETATGVVLTVRSSEREDHVAGVAVYNLEVAGSHAYRVGDEGLLVQSW